MQLATKQRMAPCTNWQAGSADVEECSRQRHGVGWFSALMEASGPPAYLSRQHLRWSVHDWQHWSGTAANPCAGMAGHDGFSDQVLE